MGRIEKLKVDYFPHFISKGKKMRYIKKKYPKGLGYSVWFIVLENLAEADHHFLDIRDDVQLMFLASECDCEGNEFIEIITEIAKIGGFDKDLLSLGIIWSEGFSNSVMEAWKRRKDQLMFKEEIKAFLGLLSNKKDKKQPLTPKDNKNDVTDDKKAKLDIIYPWTSNEFVSMWTNWKDYKRKEHRFGFKSEVSEQSALINLSKLSGGNEKAAIEIIMKSIENGWKGFYELKTVKNGSNEFAGKKESKPSVSRDYVQGVLDDLQS